MALASESGPLLRASGAEAAHGRFRWLELEFAAGTLRLACDDDTDEIVVGIADQPAAGSDVVAFEELLGMSIEYAWIFTNHRGYEDAFQLRLRDALGRCETRQFEVGASAMDVRHVSA